MQTNDSVMVNMPTGTGKTVLFSELINRWDDAENYRAMVICPMISLISQAADKIRAVTGIDPAIEQADIRSNESPLCRSPFVVASKQTLISKRNGVARYERFTDIGLVIIDECHLACTPPYKEMVDWFRERGAKIFGCTATPKRHDGKALGILFDKCSYSYGIREAVQDGWLVDANCDIIQVESLDLSDVDTAYTPQGKDFNTKQLNKKLEDMRTVAEIASITAAETKGEKTVIFCSSVDEAQLVAERLTDYHGIKCGWICADEKRCTKGTRKKLLDSFSDPDGITHLCNVGILTTGWDCPLLKNIIMARPTQSEALYCQIYGRGTRPLEGVVDFPGSTPELRREAIAGSDKPRWRIIDLVDASLSHKVVTAIDVLGGNFSSLIKKKAKVDMVERAKKLRDRAEGEPEAQRMSVDELLTLVSEEEEKLKEEEQKRKEEMRRRQRAQLKSWAKYETKTVDQYGGTRTNSRRARSQTGKLCPFGKYKDWLITDVPEGWLQWALSNCNNLWPATKKMFNDELNRRQNERVDLHDGQILHGKLKT